MAKRQPGVPRQPKRARRVRFNPGDGKADFQGKVNIQKGLRNTAPQAPKFNAAIKGALDTWSKDTDQAVVVWENIINVEAQLEQLYGTLGNLLVQVGLDRAAFITSVENVCTTPADAKSFGGDAVSSAKRPDPVAPATIRQIATQVPGDNRVRWPSAPNAVAYVAQTTTVDPPAATSWAAAYTGKSPFFLVQGTPGQKVWVRIASIGGAQSAWSKEFSVILR